MKRGFVIHHNGPNTNLLGKPHSKCVSYWNGVKNYHTSKPPKGQGWSDIAYSFGVCHHGIRFDGRGWLKNQFANGSDVVGVFDGKDSEWYTVLVFIGYDPKTGIEEIPTPEMITGVKNLIQEGRDRKSCGTRVLPHNRFKVKRCPGHVFTGLASAWDAQPLSVPSTPVDKPISFVEEDDMFTYGSPTEPVFFCHAGKSVGLNEATDLASMRAGADAAGQKLVHFNLDDDTFAKFRLAFPGN